MFSLDKLASVNVLFVICPMHVLVEAIKSAFGVEAVLQMYISMTILHFMLLA